MYQNDLFMTPLTHINLSIFICLEVIKFKILYFNRKLNKFQKKSKIKVLIYFLSNNITKIRYLRQKKFRN